MTEREAALLAVIAFALFVIALAAVIVWSGASDDRA